MIGDFKGGDEVLLSQALEAFDTLTNTTTEYRAALEGKNTGGPAVGTSAGGGAPQLQPPSSNPFQVLSELLHLLALCKLLLCSALRKVTHFSSLSNLK